VGERPVFQADPPSRDRDERAGGVLGPRPAVDVDDALARLEPGEVGVAAGDGAATLGPRVADGPLADRLAAALPALGDSPDEASGLVRGPLLDVVEEGAGQLRK